MTIATFVGILIPLCYVFVQGFLDEFRKKPAETVPVAAPRQRSTHEKEQHESTTSLGGELLARPGSPIKLNCDGAALARGPVPAEWHFREAGLRQHKELILCMLRWS